VPVLCIVLTSADRNVQNIIGSWEGIMRVKTWRYRPLLAIVLIKEHLWHFVNGGYCTRLQSRFTPNSKLIRLLDCFSTARFATSAEGYEQVRTEMRGPDQPSGEPRMPLVGSTNVAPLASSSGAARAMVDRHESRHPDECVRKFWRIATAFLHRPCVVAIRRKCIGIRLVTYASMIHATHSKHGSDLTATDFSCSSCFCWGTNSASVC